MTIPEGLRVKFRHERRVYYGAYTELMTPYVAGENGCEMLPRGGVTICRLVAADGTVVAEAQAKCSKRDNYCKRLGRQISLGRCLDALSVAGNARQGAI